MNTFLIIKQKYKNLSPVERKIADFILEKEDEVLSMSVQEMAKQTGTSAAALVRFSRTLGLEGFTQLKQKLSASLASMENPTDFEEVRQNEDVASIKSKIRIRMSNMVEQTNALLTDESVTSVSKMLDNTNMIFVYGIGASSLVAQDIFQKFTRIGKTVFFSQDMHHFAASMVAFDKNSLFIAISNSGKTKEIVTLALIAKKYKIPVIAITSSPTSDLGLAADVLLNSTSGDTFVLRAAATMSLMAQLYVVDILFYSYLSNHFDESLEGIQATRDIIRELEDKE